MLKINSSVEMEMKYDSLYSGLVSINKSLGGTQSMPDSEYGAMIDLMETLSGQPVGESGDAFDAVSTVATMAENGELPIQGGGSPSGCKLGDESTSVTSNGTYRWDAVSFGLDGFSSFQVDVNVPTDGGGGSDDKNWWYESGMKFAYSRIDSIPTWLDKNKLVNCSYFFYSCSFLTNVGDVDLPDAFLVEHMFGDCQFLETVGNINIPNCNSAAGLFDNCFKLTSIGNITSHLNSVSYMFSGCRSLTTLPELDLSGCEYADRTFQGCSKLTTVPNYDMSNIKQMGWLFSGCSELLSVPVLNFDKVTYCEGLFGNCYKLTNVGGMLNMKANLGWGALTECTNLTVESLVNIINNLYDWNQCTDGEYTWSDGTTHSYGGYHEILLSSASFEKLSEDQKAVATNKGWTILKAE